MADYIYALLCPKGEIRYIGKTNNPPRRLQKHIHLAASGKHQYHAARWIRSLLRRGEQPHLEIVCEVPEGESWVGYEVEAIREFRAEGHRLTNSTAGGEGVVGVSPEARAKGVEKARLIKSTPEYKARVGAALSKAHSSPEMRAKKSEALQIAWAERRERFLEGMRQPEAKARRSAASRRRYDDESFRQAQVERQRKYFAENPGRLSAMLGALTPQVIKRRSDSIREAYQNPELIEKMSAVNTEINNRPEVKAKRSAASKALWASNDGRQKLLEAYARPEVKEKQRKSKQESWKDLEFQRKQAESWTTERRAAQAEAVEGRREKMLAAMTPEVRAKQGAKMKEYHARKRAEKLAAMTPEQIAQEISDKKAKKAAYAKKRNLELKAEKLAKSDPTP